MEPSTQKLIHTFGALADLGQEIAGTGDRDKDVDAIVAKYTQLLEKWVRVAPEQYFWQHRRWKRQPPDTPPELRDPSA